ALAGELAAERITDEEQERLERLLVAIGRAIEEHDMERIVRTDIEFHELLYQAARNERLLAIIGNLREQLTRFRTISMSYPGRLKATLEEHRAIVDAIGAGDARHARKVGAKHMENSERTLLYAIEEQEKKTGTTLVKRKHKKSKEGME
ncbi:MAG: FCD domain-containing protein, partial [Selenomonas sp.]|nr:FCD domain-containing protein [Selenomonas sp.]